MEPTALSCVFPSVFILDPSKIPTPKYAFGFDSGAFVQGMMDDYLHPYMPLFDFLMAPDVPSAAKLVEAVFGSNADYLGNKPRNTFDIPSSNFEAECYRSIVLSGGQGSTRLDDRMSTPEFLFSDPIDLKRSVSAVVIPDSLASDKNIGDKIRNLGIEVFEYPWRSSSRPIESHFTVRTLVESFYDRQGWL